MSYNVVTGTRKRYIGIGLQMIFTVTVCSIRTRMFKVMSYKIVTGRRNDKQVDRYEFGKSSGLLILAELEHVYLR